jgi:hypothetical protein
MLYSVVLHSKFTAKSVFSLTVVIVLCGGLHNAAIYGEQLKLIAKHIPNFVAIFRVHFLHPVVSCIKSIFRSRQHNN